MGKVKAKIPGSRSITAPAAYVNFSVIAFIMAIAGKHKSWRKKNQHFILLNLILVVSFAINIFHKLLEDLTNVDYFLEKAYRFACKMNNGTILAS